MMNNKLLTFSVSAILCVLSIAFGDTTLYGKALISLESEGADEKVTQVSPHASRIGVKGKEEFGNGMSALFKYGWQIDMSDESKSSSDHIKSRNQYVGLTGGFGTVLLGRHDTPLKMSQGKFDIFGDGYGDIKHHFAGETRAGNILVYLAPKFVGVQLVGAYVPAENADNNSIFSVAAMYSSQALLASLAYNAFDEKIGIGESLLRATAIYKMGSMGVGLMYQDATPTVGDNTVAFGVSAYFNAGSNKFKLQYQDSEGQNVGVKSGKIKEDASTLSLGIDHKFSKRTVVYASLHNTTLLRRYLLLPNRHEFCRKDAFSAILVGL